MAFGCLQQRVGMQQWACGTFRQVRFIFLVVCSSFFLHSDWHSHPRFLFPPSSPSSLLGALLGKLVGHERWVKSVQLGVRDLFVISGGADRVARLWDVETRTLVRTFEGHTNVVTGVSLSGDNRELYTASAAGMGNFFFVDLSNPASLFLFLGGGPETKKTSIILSFLPLTGTIHIFDLASDKCVATLNGPVLGLLSDMLASSHPDNSNNSTLPPTPASVMCMDVDYTNRRIFAGLGESRAQGKGDKGRIFPSFFHTNFYFSP